jgi:hypothetical protein
MTRPDSGPPTVADLLRTSNRILDQHWRRPDEPWRRSCGQCTNTGCPQLESAEQYVAEVYERIRALGAGRAGTATGLVPPPVVDI